MKYTQLETNKYIIEFETEEEKDSFFKFYNDLTTISSGECEKLGISRQLLKYWVKQNYIRTVPHGKQKRYIKEDILKMKGK